MKYRMLKILDVLGLTFLSPVVRLCYGEEPRVQIRKIGRHILVPVCAMMAFLFLWSQLAPRHKTKSGEVPTPVVVWNATKGIWQFHARENEKELAYALTGAQRDAKLKAVGLRLEELESLDMIAAAQLTAATAAAEQSMSDQLAPLRKRVEEKTQEFQSASAARIQAINMTAGTLVPGDQAGRETLLDASRIHLKLEEAEREILQELKNEETELQNSLFPQLTAARDAQTAIAEERQHLQKMSEQLGRSNREFRIADAQQRVDQEQQRLLAATGPEAVAIANRIARSEERVQATAESRYARPWTLPDQIKRSLACVFFGFVLGSAIAIPIGVLCGLSPTFMSAMTPFVALFKPVSPIVWLPIALIIVGGFIPDPDKHWLITALSDAPLIGGLQINPAFIASGVTVALCSLWPTLVNTALGVASIDNDHMNVARVLRLGFWSRMYRIVIPSALPLIFAGLRISLGVGWMVLIAAELLSSSEGLGKFIWDQFNNGASDSFARMVAVVFVVGAIGFALDRTMIVLQRLVSFDGSAASL